MEEKILWGIDLGGTKIECALIKTIKSTDTFHFETILRKRIPTESAKGYHHILNQIQKLVRTVELQTGFSADRIGIGTPGTLEPSSQLLKNCNTTCLNGKPFLADVSQLLQKKVRIMNDANCFAIAETKLGSVNKLNYQAETVFGIILGTGVGGGFVVNGKALKGKHGIAGEWGHNVYEEDGEQCYCGKKGCLETMISGPALEKYYYKLSKNALSLKEIVEKKRHENDPHAIQTIDRLTSTLAHAVARIINTIDPELIIVGGGVGAIDEIYEETLIKAHAYIFNNSKVETELLRPSLGDSAGVFGAALLWDE